MSRLKEFSENLNKSNINTRKQNIVWERMLHEKEKEIGDLKKHSSILHYELENYKSIKMENQDIKEKRMELIKNSQNIIENKSREIDNLKAENTILLNEKIRLNVVILFFHINIQKSLEIRNNELVAFDEKYNSRESAIHELQETLKMHENHISKITEENKSLESQKLHDKNTISEVESLKYQMLGLENELIDYKEKQNKIFTKIRDEKDILKEKLSEYEKKVNLN
ncbi:MAG: hypothetical protein MHPSP_000578 [Paramarteilia canceri]